MEWVVDDDRIKCSREGYRCELIERTFGHMEEAQVKSCEQMISSKLLVTKHMKC